jgi:hypothetical protein
MTHSTKIRQGVFVTLIILVYMALVDPSTNLFLAVLPLTLLIVCYLVSQSAIFERIYVRSKPVATIVITLISNIAAFVGGNLEHAQNSHFALLLSLVVSNLLLLDKIWNWGAISRKRKEDADQTEAKDIEETETKNDYLWLNSNRTLQKR